MAARTVPYVRFVSFGDIATRPRHVRFTSNNGRCAPRAPHAPSNLAGLSSRLNFLSVGISRLRISRVDNDTSKYLRAQVDPPHRSQRPPAGLFRQADP